MTQHKFTFQRHFSVGYSAAETDRLMEKFEVSTTFNVYPNGAIVKHETGEKFTMGAYDGYFIVDGDHREYERLKEAYRLQ